MRKNKEVSRRWVFNETTMNVEDAIDAGETVAVRMIWRGRRTGDLPDTPATKRAFEIVGFGLDRFREGRSIEYTPLFDQYALLQQRGFVVKDCERFLARITQGSGTRYGNSIAASSGYHRRDSKGIR